MWGPYATVSGEHIVLAYGPHFTSAHDIHTAVMWLITYAI